MIIGRWSGAVPLTNGLRLSPRWYVVIACEAAAASASTILYMYKVLWLWWRHCRRDSSSQRRRRRRQFLEVLPLSVEKSSKSTKFWREKIIQGYFYNTDSSSIDLHNTQFKIVPSKWVCTAPSSKKCCILRPNSPASLTDLANTLFWNFKIMPRMLFR